MYKQAIFAFTLFFLFSLLTPVKAQSVQNNKCSKVYKVMIEPFPPYVILIGKNHWAGSEVTMLRKIFKDAQCQFEFVRAGSTAKRALLELKKGSFDIVMGASKLAKREEFAWFSKPYRIERIRAFVRKNVKEKFNIKTLKDIFDNQLLIIASPGAWYGTEFNAYRESAKHSQFISGFGNLKHRLQMLNDGLADALIDDQQSVIYWIKQNKENVPLSMLDITVIQDNVHLIFSKKSVAKLDVDHLNQFIKKPE